MWSGHKANQNLLRKIQKGIIPYRFFISAPESAFIFVHIFMKKSLTVYMASHFTIYYAK